MGNAIIEKYHGDYRYLLKIDRAQDFVQDNSF